MCEVLNKGCHGEGRGSGESMESFRPGSRPAQSQAWDYEQILSALSVFLFSGE